MKTPNSDEMRRILEAQPERVIHMVFVMVMLLSLHRKARCWIILACAACAVFSWVVPWLAVLAVVIFLYLIFPIRVISVVGFIWRSLI